VLFAGYEIATTDRQIFQSNISHMVMSSRGVAGSMSSCTSFVTGANPVAKENNEKGSDF
jgi:hypothetical protein